jgi:Phosphodiester glycosidase
MKSNFIRLNAGMLCLLLIAMTSCKKSTLPAATETTDISNPRGLNLTPSAVTIPSDWVRQTNFTLPASINVYRKSSNFKGRSFNGYLAVADLRNRSLAFKPVFSSTNKTPQSFYNAEGGTKYITVNGGFFDQQSGASFSTVIQNNVVLSKNVASVTRNGRTYYPTRAAFGFNPSNRGYSASWIYHLTDGRVFNWGAPAANNPNTTPLPRPTSTTPGGGSQWGVTDAIGGGPMLVFNGVRSVYDVPELIDVSNNSNRARTAYGYTSDGRMLILCVQGNAFPETGVTLTEMGDLMAGFGAVRAVNFDGSGSSCMLINGIQTITPTFGNQREVPSCLFIKAVP